MKRYNFYLLKKSFELLFINLCIYYVIQFLPTSMHATDLMSINVVAAKFSLAASEISARLFLREFNGVPVIDNNQKVIDIVLQLTS